MEIFANKSAPLTEKGRIFYSFFLRFLKEHKCFYEYQRAFCKNEYRAVRIRRFINLCNAWDSSILISSFIWAETIEGQKFWECIDKEFRYLSSHVGIKT